MAKSTAVSLTFKGDGSSKATGGDSGGSDKLRKSMEKNAESSQKLSNSIIEGLGLSKLLADIFGGMYKLLSPILRILSVIGILILLPLMPIFKLVAQGLAYFAKLLAPGGGNIVEKIVAWIIAILTFVAGILFLIFGGWLLAILVAIGLLLMFGWKYIATALKWIWDNLLKPIWDVIVFGLQSAWMLLKAVWDVIVFGLQSTWALLQVAWDFLVNAGKWIWDSILKPAFDFLATVGTWIWDSILKPAFNFLKDVGTWIWDILKTPFNALASAISGAISFIRGLFRDGGSSKSSTTSKSVKDAIITPQGVVHTDPNDFIIATKNPSALGGNSVKTKSSNTINFNNPVVRNEQDINKIADAVSKILIKAGKNRY